MPKRELFLLLIITSLFTTLSLNAQDISAQLKEAEAFHTSYEFNKAIEIYNKLIKETAQDTTSKDAVTNLSMLNKLLAQSQNGSNMLDFAYSPNVLMAKESSAKTFFLLYPGFDNGKWVLTPPEFAGESGERSYMFLPDNARKLVFSAKDNSGSWNIYTSLLKENGEWTYPEMLNENITSTGDELFPYITDNGKTLYFSSNGHYGMGGFDIYVSKWDENSNDWGVAQNLGFPFSSPKDDFLYYDTPDGNYSLFASTRDTKRDSIMVFALAFENLPVKKRISPSEAREISHLAPVHNTVTADNQATEDEKSSSTDDNSTEYTEFRSVVTTVRSLRKQIRDAITSINDKRNLYNTLTDETDLKTLAHKISEQETAVLQMRDSLNKTSSKLQELEMDFLSKGIIISQETEEEAAPAGAAKQETRKEETLFRFANNTLGETPMFTVEAAVPPTGITLKIEETTPMVYEFSTLPEGLVYQYQLFVVSQQQETERFGGITPVFEKKAASGKYIYTAGIFRNYSGALANVNKVKKLGFPNAMIIAYDSGKPLTLSAARAMEKRLKAEGKLPETNNEMDKVAKQSGNSRVSKSSSDTYRINITGYTENISEAVLKVIRENTEKDIAKHIDGGVLVYSIGVFSDKAEADKLAALIDKAANGGESKESLESKEGMEGMENTEGKESIESTELENTQQGNKIIVAVEKIEINR